MESIAITYTVILYFKTCCLSEKKDRVRVKKLEGNVILYCDNNSPIKNNTATAK